MQRCGSSLDFRGGGGGGYQVKPVGASTDIFIVFLAPFLLRAAALFLPFFMEAGYHQAHVGHFGNLLVDSDLFEH